MKKNIFFGTAAIILCAALTAFSLSVYRDRAQRSRAASDNISETGESAQYPTYTVTENDTVIHAAPSDESAEVGILFAGSVVDGMAEAENSFMRVYDKESDTTGYVSKGLLKRSEFSYSLSDIDVVDISSALYSYEEMESDIALLSEKYSAFSASSVGKSEDGRSIFKVSVGNAPKKILLIGGISGTDYTTSQLLMKQAEYYSHYINDGYFFGYKYSDLIQNVSIDIVPMLNPDGITINQFGPDALISDNQRRKVSDTFYSDKNSGYTDDVKTTYYLSWKANSNGVDIDLNFPSGFDAKTSAKQMSRSDYKGAYALCESESRAASDLLDGGYSAVIILGADGSGVTYSEGTDGDTAYGSAREFAQSIAEFTGCTLNDKYSLSGRGGSLLSYCADSGIPTVRIGITINGDVPRAKDIHEPWTRLRELNMFLARRFL